MKLFQYLLLTIVFLTIVVIYSLLAWHGESGTINYQPMETSTILELTTTSSPVAKNIDKVINQNGEKNLLAKSPSYLSEDLISRIKTFVIFIGRGRSGSSIVEALMNAHPHMAIAHEYYIIKNWPEKSITSPSWTSSLYNTLYKKTINQKFKNSKKGYTLSVNGSWQGKIDEYVSVIGDKGASHFSMQYINEKSLFFERYHQLKNKIPIPIRFMHTMRNPFDHIATLMLYHTHSALELSEIKIRASKSSWRYDNKKKLEHEINEFFTIFDTVMEMVDLFGRENVHVIHSSDLVHSPRETMSKLCEFVGVECTKDYLDVCERKIFKDVSRTRDIVVWNEQLKGMVEEKMKRYPMYFQRYSFTSD